ncbi:hypothetical protein APA_4852 [Pseudanabaena sp. lw0831]|nr:hypothetical protein APA_4852 [Pseudanabaena sp. lw0831]
MDIFKDCVVSTVFKYKRIAALHAVILFITSISHYQNRLHNENCCFITL